MKIIFLDIDGVLNSGEFVRSDRWEQKQDKGLSFPDTHLDPIAIQMINKLCKEAGAKVILSSTRREMDNIILVLRRNGLKAQIIGKTPSLDRKLKSGVWTSKTRGEEIQAWLDNNDCDQYLIIDDDSDMLPGQQDRFIHTNRRYGFTDEELETAIKMLNQEK